MLYCCKIVTGVNLTRIIYELNVNSVMQFLSVRTRLSHCQKFSPAQKTFWHQKDVDLTAFTDVESLRKYSTTLKAESHPVHVHSCHLLHFVKWGLQRFSDIKDVKCQTGGHNVIPDIQHTCKPVVTYIFKSTVYWIVKHFNIWCYLG